MADLIAGEDNRVNCQVQVDASRCPIDLLDSAGKVRQGLRIPEERRLGVSSCLRWWFSLLRDGPPSGLLRVCSRVQTRPAAGLLGHLPA